MSSYYDEDDDIDIRVRRRRASPQPVIYPEHRQANYRSFPRRPPIYPPRRIRRSSTLPVRFEDESFVERAPLPALAPTPRRYHLREDVVTRVLPVRRQSIDSLTSSDSEAEQRKREGENEKEPLVVKDAENEGARRLSRASELEPRFQDPLMRSTTVIVDEPSEMEPGKSGSLNKGVTKSGRLYHSSKRPCA
jgi:hypothetical protein